MRGFILLALFFISIYGQSQEVPPIANYTPLEYGAENQNWDVTQSKEKNIYVANNSGLLEYNGAIWKLYGSPNGSTIRSVKAINKLVYTGCYMEFGYWEKNAIGDLTYTSISGKLDIPMLEDEEFWKILELDSWVLFQSLERIYIYNTSDESVTILDSKSTKAYMSKFNGTIYYQSSAKGLFKVENGESVLLSDDPIIKSSVISGIFSIANRTLIVTEKGKFYFLEDGNLVYWDKPFGRQSASINVFSSLQLEDGSIVIGTISDGVFRFDDKGKILQHIDQEGGLNNNTVLSIFEDSAHNLWLALDNGISIINMDSPFNEYIDRNGKLGVVYASAIYKDNLYLGTNQGLFYKPAVADGDFNLVKGTEGQVWLLKIIDEVLFCGHNNGTFVVDRERAELISDFPGTWDLKPIPNKNNLLLQGNFNGLSVLSRNNNKWNLRNVIDGFDISSRFFEFVGDNKIIVNRELKGIFKLDLDSDFTRVIEASSEASKGEGASLVSYGDKVLYTCNNGIFSYDNGKKEFANDTLFTNIFYGKKDDPIGIFIPDSESKRLWCFTNTNMVYLSPGKLNTRPNLNKISIPSFVRKNLGVLGFESLTPLGNERYLIGISNGYLTVDLRKLAAKEYSVRINSISRKSNGSVFEKIAQDSAITYNSNQNNLIFSYSVPEYDKYTEVNYQYQLEGMYESWSDWADTSDVSFENLPFGNYAFKVRARVGNDLSTNTASYEFRIERPWYLSNLAFFLYLLGFVSLAFLIHKLYKNYYKKQREQLLRENKKNLKRKKLKAQKKIVQIKNDKLREEVESKNRELAISTMSIIKKNEFLNAIKDQLRETENNLEVQSVIRTIDRNINNVDDWKFFEDAFNNADKDFLKKIKSHHPELTANDLRLCAYLRLNLSSKEIAPLLNISVRSVEVKRYRLRKKMDLEHEKGLSDYIMQI